ncbi:MAG TPA: type II toxin-antitoxin system VapC family toxin [Burkholderiales bacterium]|nr:type II toxin-antitoxin system VapC family toxin [Burkholderiales bacterium]
MSFLLDTSVVSELVKKLPNEGVLSWLSRQDEDSLYLSVLTLGELEKGISKLRASARRDRLRSWLSRDLAARFADRLLLVDVPVATRWGTLTGDAEKRGTPLPVIDSLIAATALEHGFSVVTRNVTDFERCGVACVDPWKEQAD